MQRYEQKGRTQEDQVANYVATVASLYAGILLLRPGLLDPNKDNRAKVAGDLLKLATAYDQAVKGPLRERLRDPVNGQPLNIETLVADCSAVLEGKEPARIERLETAVDNYQAEAA